MPYFLNHRNEKRLNEFLRSAAWECLETDMKYVDSHPGRLRLTLFLCSVVREINKINERELDLGVTGSWHDDYKGQTQKSPDNHSY